VKDRKDELNNETFCIETCREFCLNDTQMEINNVQDCSRSVLAVWLLKFMGKMLQKHQAFLYTFRPKCCNKSFSNCFNESSWMFQQELEILLFDVDTWVSNMHFLATVICRPNYITQRIDFVTSSDVIGINRLIRLSKWYYCRLWLMMILSECLRHKAGLCHSLY